ncbi:hypothetical protein JOL79_15585 [Microbispora sp. RL4-1S]|uniref:Uncharacterized protein n=1 Tax=Microbispora oryzae TaxID=2806554 RepID=A0A941AKG8_9ACTN|nr:hypothetical protein [Microbispora oryzae]MBP2705238.1 hypothetical protein [Microbispora oryzae]
MISRKCSSASGSRTAGRLLAWGAAATVACATMGLGSAAAGAATENTAAVNHQVQAQPQWLDSTFMVIPATNANTPGRVFRVSANGGIPWILDPNTGVWQNLRGIQGSQGATVVNITVANRTPMASEVGVDASLVITARTSDSQIWQTTCRWGTATGTSPLPATTTATFFPNSPNLTPPCGPNWVPAGSV